MNYDDLMEKQIAAIDGKKKLLLHVCCAPCSTAVIDRLNNYFEITCFFYNPNITIEEEYNKRFLELRKYLKYSNIKIKDAVYEPQVFLDLSRNLEKEKERGKRCQLCYNLRLEETAKQAEKNNFDFFTTTLTLSPHKDSNYINEIGSNLDKKYNSTYLYSDFKKKDGYKKSIEFSKKYDLYRQDYCGCIYSKINK